MILNNRNPIIIRRRKGTVDDPFVDITETLVVDQNAKVTLTEIPDRFHKVRVTAELGNWYEIEDGVLGATEYRVDYTNKLVTFHRSHIGKQFTFEYKGTGMEFVPTSMIYTKQVNGEITQMLDEVTESASEIIEGAVIATNNANTKANLANEKASLADTKARLADEKANLADQKASIANANANVANEKATYAQTQGDYAKTQGTNASNSASLATEKANLAEEKGSFAITQGNYAKAQGDYAKSIGDSTKTQTESLIGNFTFKGDYSSSVTYKPYNMVRYQNSSYICIQESTSNLPTAQTHWQLIALKGMDGMGSVDSVNGQGGHVVLDAEDVGAVPSSLIGVAGGVARLNNNGKVVDSAGNLVEGKVTSVNGKIGDVELTASEVGAIPSSTLNTLSTKNELNSHASNKSNPHNVTAEQVGAYTKSQIDNSLGILNGEIDTLETNLSVVNDALTTHQNDNASLTQKGHVQLSSATNSTSETLAATPKAVKLAFDLANEAKQSASNGKTAIGSAITGVDSSVVIPTNPSFQDLATAIGSISTGKKWASGVQNIPANSPSYNFDTHSGSTHTTKKVVVSNLDFKPSFIFMLNDSTSFSYRPLTIYSNLPFRTSGNTPIYMNLGNTIASNELSIKLTGQAYVNQGGFSLPIEGYNSTSALSVIWIAFE